MLKHIKELYSSLIIELLVLLTCISLFSACKKIEPYKNETKALTTTEHFFNIKNVTDPLIVRIANEIKKRNNKNEFVIEFAKKNGFPIWDKPLIKYLVSDFGRNNKVNSVVNEEPTDTFAYIPILLENDNKVNGFILAKINNGVDLIYSLAKDYKAFSFENDSINLNEASKIALNMMLLNTKVFGITDYKITDYRLMVFDTIYDKPNGFLSITSRMAGQCWNVTWAILHCGTPNEQCCSDADGCDGINGNCPTGQCYVQNPVIEICTGSSDVNWPPGGIGVGSTSSGSGPSGGGQIPHYYPCVSSPVPLLPDGPLPPCPEPEPGTGWIPLNNNIVSSIQNNLSNPCLIEVYNKINSNRFKNAIQNCLNKLTNDKFIQIEFNESISMPNNEYAHTVGFLASTITFNTNLLPSCSQEKVAEVFFHEIVHSFIETYLHEYATSPTIEHNLMLQDCMRQLVLALRQVFPNLPEKDAWCIVIEGMVPSSEDDPAAIEDLNNSRILCIQYIASIWPTLNTEAEILTVAHQYSETGTLGTRTANCN